MNVPTNLVLHFQVILDFKLLIGLGWGDRNVVQYSGA